MVKVALLIGVSAYEGDLAPLPSAANDVAAIERVLKNPDIGGFDQVKPLINPDLQKMQEALEGTFADRNRDDLVLLFFSGHGIMDESGKLYLATSKSKTWKDRLWSSTINPDFISDLMDTCRAKRQVVILDCSFSGAFIKSVKAHGSGNAIDEQLGAPGKAILTSSSSSQYSFEEKESGLSLYTRYLVEGLETGAADFDGDGRISTSELHRYVKERTHINAPAISPQIHTVGEGYNIFLAKSLYNDRKREYRKEVEQQASVNGITPVGRRILDARREILALTLEETAEIEDQVLKPYQWYTKSLQNYEQVLTEEVEREYPFSEATRQSLRQYRDILMLTDEDIAPIHAKILAVKQSDQAKPKASNGHKSKASNGYKVRPIYRFYLPKNATEEEHQAFKRSLEQLKKTNPEWAVTADWTRANEESAVVMIHKDENYVSHRIAYLMTEAFSNILRGDYGS